MNIRKKLYGIEHPDSLTSMENLASTYRSQGRWSEAKKLMLEVKDIKLRMERK